MGDHDNIPTKKCRYGCSKTIYYDDQDKSKGSTGWYELGTTIEHTYPRCIELLKEQGKYSKDTFAKK